MQQSILWHSLHNSSFRTEVVAPLQPNEVLIEAHHSLVSTGTERLVISESIPVMTAQHMRVPYMRGEFDAEFSYGYSMTGVVKQGPTRYIGKAVHVMHPHQAWAVVNTDSIYLLPSDMNLLSATLISNMETAVNALWDAKIALGDRVLVLGYGIIGTLICALVKALPGVELTVVETAPARAQAAQRAGIKVVSDIGELTTPMDTAFHTTATNAGLQSAIDALDVEGTVIELSWDGDRDSTIKLGGSFHYGRKRILSSQVSRIPTDKSERWDFVARKDLVVKLLSNLDTSSIITQSIDFRHADSFFNALRDRQSVERGIAINYKEN